MVKSQFHIFKVLLIVACLAMSNGIMAQVNPSQPEMEQNQIEFAISKSTIRIKNAEGITLEIFSLTGEKVYTQRIDSDSKSYELASLHKGFYIVKIGKFTRKIYLP